MYATYQTAYDIQQAISVKLLESKNNVCNANVLYTPVWIYNDDWTPGSQIAKLGMHLRWWW